MGALLTPGCGEWPTSGYLVVLRVQAGFVVTPQDSRQQVPKPAWATCAGPPPTCRPVAPRPSTRSPCDGGEWVGLSASFRPTAPPACVWADSWHGAFNADPWLWGWCVQRASGAHLGLRVEPWPLSSPSASTGAAGGASPSPLAGLFPHQDSCLTLPGAGSALREGGRQLGAEAREAARLIQY